MICQCLGWMNDMSKSIITKYEDYSVFSGVPAECRHHLCFGRGIRDKADADGLWIPLLNREHNMSQKGTINQIHGNPAAEKLSKMLGQVAFEKEYYRSIVCGKNNENDPAREEFRKIFGKSYL